MLQSVGNEVKMGRREQSADLFKPLAGRLPDASLLRLQHDVNVKWCEIHNGQHGDLMFLWTMAVNE